MSEAYKPRCDVPQRICSCPTAPATLVEHLSPGKSDKGNTSAPHKTAIYNMRVYATPPHSNVFQEKSTADTTCPLHGDRVSAWVHQATLTKLHTGCVFPNLVSQSSPSA